MGYDLLRSKSYNDCNLNVTHLSPCSLAEAKERVDVPFIKYEIHFGAF